MSYLGSECIRLAHFVAKYATPERAYFDVVPPVLLTVVLGDLWLDGRHLGHGGGQSGQRLPPAPAHTHQHSVAAGLPQHTTDAG